MIHHDRIATTKQSAAGRWPDILAAAGIDADLLDGRGHPCPRCGGTDRFHAEQTVADTGAVFCRGCFHKDTTPKPSDGIASVAWVRGLSMGDAAAWVAEYLGLTSDDDAPKPVDIIADVARDKRMPIEAFKRFGPEPAKRGKRDVARVPVHDASGEVHSYYDLASGCKGWFKRGKGSAGMFFPGRLPNPDETWLLVEGVKDAAALIGLGYNAAGLPTSYAPDKYARLFADVDVVCVPDLDTAGQLGAQRTGGNLSSIAASVRIARLPGEIRASGGDDVRDVLRRPDGERLVREAIEAAATWEPAEGDTREDGRPTVLLTLTEGHVADQCVRHLGRLGWQTDWIPEGLRESAKVYSRGGQLVHAVASEDPNTRGQTVIRPLPSPLVRERITQACQLVVEREADGETIVEATRPPKWLTDSVHVRGWYGGNVRPLVGIIAAPTIRPDGSILQTPGYDDATALLYRPSTTFPAVPERPSRDDAKAAIGELLEVVADFPTVADADRSAWVTLVLSMIGRPCVTGCVPMFGVTATTRGTGKGLSVDAASQIAYGHRSPCETFTLDDDEMGKRITAHAIEGTPAVLFDNVATKLGGANLDAVLTTNVWRGRVLGSSKSTGKLPMHTIWMATGNNLLFGSDLARRVLPIRMETTEERPEDRDDFRHPDLLGWVTENRPRFAVAALTILRAYFVAGCPEQKGGTWGSFESWSRLIRGSVVWAGAADPMATRETARESDDSHTLLGMLIHGLREAGADGDGLTAKEIERLTAHRPDESPTCPTLVEAVAQICGDRPNARRIGARLRSYAGRVCDKRRIVADRGHNNVTRWAVRGESGGHAQPSGDMGEVGFSHVPHDSPRKTRDETPVGGHGGHSSRPYAYRSEQSSSHEGINTHAAQSGNAAGECPPCPPCPPQPSAPCPRCGGKLARLADTPEVDGWVNLDCTTPGCDHVKAVKVEGVKQ